MEEVEWMKPAKNEKKGKLQFKGSLGSNIDIDRVNTRHFRENTRFSYFSRVQQHTSLAPEITNEGNMKRPQRRME